MSVVQSGRMHEQSDILISVQDLPQLTAHTRTQGIRISRPSVTNEGFPCTMRWGRKSESKFAHPYLHLIHPSIRRLAVVLYHHDDRWNVASFLRRTLTPPTTSDAGFRSCAPLQASPAQKRTTGGGHKQWEEAHQAHQAHQARTYRLAAGGASTHSTLIGAPKKYIPRPTWHFPSARICLVARLAIVPSYEYTYRLTFRDSIVTLQHGVSSGGRAFGPHVGPMPDTVMHYPTCSIRAGADPARS